MKRASIIHWLLDAVPKQTIATIGTLRAIDASATARIWAEDVFRRVIPNPFIHRNQRPIQLRASPA